MASVAEFVEVVARFEFMQRSPVAILLTGVVNGVVVAFVVTRQMAFLLVPGSGCAWSLVSGRLI